MIKSHRLTIKALKEKHLEDLRNLRNDPETNTYLTTNIPINEISQKEWFKKLCLDGSKMYMAIESPEDNFMGVVRVDEWDKVNRSVRIGIDIHKDFRGKGFATEAYKALFKYFFEDLSINRIWLEVVDYNSIAISLYNKLGFVKEGVMREAVFRNNKFHDYIIMSLLKTEYEKKYSAQ